MEPVVPSNRTLWQRDPGKGFAHRHSLTCVVCESGNPIFLCNKDGWMVKRKGLYGAATAFPSPIIRYM